MDVNMKPSLAADEMFSDELGYMEMDEISSLRPGGATRLFKRPPRIPVDIPLVDLPLDAERDDILDITDKHVHANFYNDFDDLFEEDNWAKTKASGDSAK